MKSEPKDGDDTVPMSRDAIEEALAHCDSASQRAAKTLSSMRVRAAERASQKEVK